MEYILFIHKDTNSRPTNKQWDEFFIAAKESGLFLGGSEISNQIQIGNQSIQKITDNIGGFMCFESNDKRSIMKLLETHPVVMQGGTVELCEMPKSKI